MLIRRILGCVWLAVTAGCLASDDPESEVAYLLPPCDQPFCGNTPHVGNNPVVDLDENGVEYSTISGVGLKWDSFIGPQGANLHLHVDNFRLYGLRFSDNMMVQGSQLVGSRIIIETDTVPQEVFELTIDTYSPTHYYENRDDGTPLSIKPAYGITYRDVHDPTYTHHNLCGADGVTPPPPALFFQGDRFDPYAGTITATGPMQWFNVACVNDDARGKLALMGFVDAAEDASHHTVLNERIAGLRSIRADYCGTGVPFTVLGTAIDWESTRGFPILDAPNEPIEAIWTETGAFCLSNPRAYTLKYVSNNGCAPQLCAGYDDYATEWKHYGSWVTRNP